MDETVNLRRSLCLIVLFGVMTAWITQLCRLATTISPSYAAGECVACQFICLALCLHTENACVYEEHDLQQCSDKCSFHCSCGKCSVAGIFQSTCPLAFSPRTPSTRCGSAKVYESHFANILFVLLNSVPIIDYSSVEAPLLLCRRQVLYNLLLQKHHCDRIHSSSVLSTREKNGTSVKDELNLAYLVDSDFFHSKTLSNFSVNTEQVALNSYLLQRPHTLKNEMPDFCYVKKKWKVLLSLRNERPVYENSPVEVAKMLLLLLLLSGDVEVNPGPMTMSDIVKHHSDHMRSQPCDTQIGILKLSRLVLIPKSKTVDENHSLENFYEDICASSKYHFVASLIFQFMSALLCLHLTKEEENALAEIIKGQSKEVFQSRDVKFVKMLVDWSYEGKESLVEAEILPQSALKSKEDAIELLCQSVQKGLLLPTDSSLKEIYSRVTNDLYRRQVQDVLISQKWAPRAVGKSHTGLVGKASRSSPPLKGVDDKQHSHTGSWTTTIVDYGKQSHGLSPPSIGELATLPLLGGEAWKEVGKYLFIDDLTIQLIDRKFSTPIKKQKELFRTYWKKSSRPSWEDVLYALVKIGKRDVGKQIIETYDLPQGLLSDVASSLPVHSASSTAGGASVASVDTGISTATADTTAVTNSSEIEEVDGGTPLTDRSSRSEFQHHLDPLCSSPEISTPKSFSKSNVFPDGGEIEPHLLMKNRFTDEELAVRSTRFKTAHSPARVQRRVVADGDYSSPILEIERFDPIDQPISDQAFNKRQRHKTEEIHVRARPRVAADGERLSPEPLETAHEHIKSLPVSFEEDVVVKNESRVGTDKGSLLLAQTLQKRTKNVPSNLELSTSIRDDVQIKSQRRVGTDEGKELSTPPQTSDPREKLDNVNMRETLACQQLLPVEGEPRLSTDYEDLQPLQMPASHDTDSPVSSGEEQHFRSRIISDGTVLPSQKLPSSPGQGSAFSIDKCDVDVRSNVTTDDGSMALSEEFHSAEEPPECDDYLDSPFMFTQKTQADCSILQPKKVKPHELKISVKILHEAIMNEDIERICSCIEQHDILLNQVLERDTGLRGIHLAAKHGFKDVFQVLLRLKASLTLTDSNGCTPLHLAASCGNYEIAKMILATRDCNIHTLTEDGTPLLLDPASKGFSMICELLLENGADPLTENKNGMSPLYIASENGHKDVVRTLLKFGADPSRICRQTSKTPLQAAMDHGYIEVLKLLMKALASIDRENDKLFECKTVEDVQTSVNGKAKVDALKADGSTPLIVHTSRGNKEVVQELINQGANVDKQDNDGWSALMVASRKGNMEIVQVLISAGAIPDLKNKEGLTALMCATLSEHVKIVKELLLAKADPNLKIKNGRSALEIAEQRGSRELITAMKRHTMSTASSGNDPLFGLLGSYLELKKQTGAQRQAVKKTAKRKGASSLLLPRLTQAQADETTSDRKKLNEQYKRISELETRIHDLSLQIHMQPPEDTDLSYLERKRLEDEFRKLKELKLKAEKYAIEAKQTTQRLSAENSKLREDLSRERKHNEMTRSNIIRELEERSSRDALTGEKMAIRAEVYDREVKGKAYQLAHASPQMQVGQRKVELTMKDVKDTMFKQSCKVNLPKIVVMGIAGAGKSTFINSFLGLRQSSSTFIIGDIDVSTDTATDETCDIITLHDKVRESHLVIKSSTGDSSSLQKLSLALAQGLVRAHRVPSFADSESSLDQSSMFSNTTFNKHFNEAYISAKKLTRQLESKGSLDLLGNGLLSFVDVADTGVSKTASEAFISLAVHCRKHMLILNLLNLERDTPESLTVPPDFYDSASPHETSRPANVRNFKSALQSIKHSASMVSQASTTPKVLLVGTHKDKLPERRLSEAKHCLKQIAMSYAEKVGVMDTISPRIEFVDATSKRDCKHVQDHLMQIVQDRDEFQVEVPVKFLFFQSYLQAMNRMFISRRKLVEEAHRCDMTDEEEIEKFLILFNTCGSIVYSSNGEIPTLKDYVILNPNKFFKALDKLHDMDMKAISDNPELIKDTYAAKLGFLSENLASHLWPEEGEGKLTQAHFIISVLRDLKLALPKKSLRIDASVDGGKMVYFLPTLRPECDTTELTGDSSSLFITHRNTVLPFPVATDVLLQLQNRLGESLTFEPKPYHNTLTFKWHDAQEQRDAEVTVRFTSDHVEVAVGFPTHAPRISTATKLFSKLKTAVVELFQQLSGRIKGLEYELAVVCPHSQESSHRSGKLPPPSVVPKPVHYVAFGPLTSRRDERLVCQTCKEVVTVEKLSWARQLWTQVAYSGTSTSTRGDEGYLSPGHISLIAQSLASGHSQEKLQYLLELLGLSSEDMFKNGLQESMEGLLYQLILTWKRRNPVNSLNKLAKILQTSGCLQEAIELDPEVLDSDTNTTSKRRALTDCQLSLIATHVQESDLKLLIQGLGPSPSIKPDSTSLTTRFESLRSAVRECKVQGKGGDIKRENLVCKLREFGYNHLAFTVESE